jgi:protein transport protein SEC61 subunit gamma-like protein
MSVNIKEGIKKYLRVLKVAKKPTLKEMKTVLRICGIGFLIIGALGFVFYMISIFFGG